MIPPNEFGGWSNSGTVVVINNNRAGIGNLPGHVFKMKARFSYLGCQIKVFKSFDLKPDGAFGRETFNG